MRLINAVLAHHDPSSTEQLGDSLRKEFRNLVVVNSATELRSAVARYRAPFAVVDLELISLDELKHLCQDSPATAFVCIHRLADDRMWSDALAVGAVDCCHCDDLAGILYASERYVVLSRSRAASAA
jgi:DNA-binding NarL/FixJ family response regulator